MKTASIILGVIGGLFALALGATWVSNYNEYKGTIDEIAAVGPALGGNAESDAALAMVERARNAGYLLMLGGLAGIVAATLAGKLGRFSAHVLIAGAVIPAVFAAKSLVFSFPLILAGLLALKIEPKSKRIATPKPAVELMTAY